MLFSIQWTVHTRLKPVVLILGVESWLRWNCFTVHSVFATCCLQRLIQGQKLAKQARLSQAGALSSLSAEYCVLQTLWV